VFAAQDREKRGEGKPETPAFLVSRKLREAPEQWSVHCLAENGEETHGGRSCTHLKQSCAAGYRDTCR